MISGAQVVDVIDALDVAGVGDDGLEPLLRSPVTRSFRFLVQRHRRFPGIAPRPFAGAARHDLAVDPLASRTISSTLAHSG